MNPKEVLKFAADQKAEFFDLRFTDLIGSGQHLTFPIEELSEGSFQDGFGFDASSLRGWAAINESEADYGRNLNVSSAGAVGWMQFMPGTWRTYGTDASGDGIADPNDPYDAIESAAIYLEAAGGRRDIRRAVFAYNHAWWYVDRVLRIAARMH